MLSVPMKTMSILKKLSSVGWLWLIASILVGCVHQVSPSGKSEESDSTNDSALHAHWGYRGIEGPTHWAMLSKEYTACEKGHRQSPINLSRPSHPSAGSLNIHYNPSLVHQTNNGHSLQINYQAGSSVELNGRIYKLRQFHFHEPSEHHLDGKGYAMEMHLVHQDTTGHILVMGVFMEVGATHPVLSKLEQWAPEQAGKTSKALELNVQALLPENLTHLSYHGSLTTPPCTEGVQWLVFEEPIHLSQEQADHFLAIVGMNTRPIQPGEHRLIEEN